MAPMREAMKTRWKTLHRKECKKRFTENKV